MTYKNRKRVKKAKRLVAAMAGAAVLSSAMLPLVSAAQLPTTATPAAVQQAPDKKPAERADQVTPSDRTDSRHKQPVEVLTASLIKIAREQASARGYDTNRADFSLQWHSNNNASVIMTTDQGRKYNIRLAKDDGGLWQVESISKISDGQLSGDIGTNNPLAVVKANASRFGFDTNSDSFTLLSQSATKAIVQVRHRGGQTFKVDLERKGGQWSITTIRGIGNMKYPATYIPASMFPHNIVIAKPSVPVINQQIHYQTNNYANWTWNEKAYPSDMYFGIFTRPPQPSDTTAVLPDAVTKALNDIDYSRQLVLYANLGSVGYKGYGIGIEKVTQAGNTLFVTVRAKSPGLTETALTATKAYDYIPINRAVLDFSKSVQVNFITPEGYGLSWYTFVPQR